MSEHCLALDVFLVVLQVGDDGGGAGMRVVRMTWDVQWSMVGVRVLIHVHRLLWARLALVALTKLLVRLWRLLQLLFAHLLLLTKPKASF